MEGPCGRVYVTARCPSVYLSHLPTAAAACGGFAAVGPWAGNIDRLLHGRFWSHTKLRWPVDVRVRAPAGGPRRLQSVTNDDRPYRDAASTHRMAKQRESGCRLTCSKQSKKRIFDESAGCSLYMPSKLHRT